MTPTEHDSQNLTRRERRDQARDQRKLQEQAESQAALRRRRMILLGGVVGIVVVAIVVIVVATKGSKNPTTETHVPTNTSAQREAAAAVEGMIKGIPQQGVTLGNPKAPVTLQYFGDLECPICREFTLGALPSIIQNDVRTGKLKIEYRSLETATHEPTVFRNQQVAAYAAGKQKKAWYYIELFYHEQGDETSSYVTDKYLSGLAAQIPGLNVNQWGSDRQSSTLTTKVNGDTQAAAAAGYNSTPTILVSGPKSQAQPIVGNTTYGQLQSAIQSVS
jgi:protein-disulfide isomerase